MEYKDYKKLFESEFKLNQLKEDVIYMLSKIDKLRYNNELFYDEEVIEFFKRNFKEEYNARKQEIKEGLGE